ncbi:50S ribosomal protein L13, partial [Patescibacteria group bacterium]|nr:50S ribosomal protein L13 [Patescibacteria group bacterium]
MKPQRSHIPKKITRQWLEIDASSKPLGRIATAIANSLRGKTKRDYTPHMDMGDFVVAVNVEKIKFTGRKIAQKKYHHYTGYPGGLRTKTLKDLIASKPDDVLRRAVFNMIDDNKL